ncbi:hypothetical protein [uncultured Psychroserpens sp.]|uniref:hypothetical protein n=1 Tax=uncultured Psychroserpens sp. TaxID=255436 RepID=UPI002635BC14|nr:hypothetical protein [uncultured Psychroserpens sp.]
MNKIPKNLKYLIFGISLLFFIGLYSGFGTRLMVGITNKLLPITNYFFAFSSTRFDYLILSAIPIFGMLYNSTRTDFKFIELIMDIATILFSAIIMFGIGLFILTFIGKPENPLMPQYIVTEPFELYTTICIGFGIGFPFLIIKLIKNKKHYAQQRV